MDQQLDTFWESLRTFLNEFAGYLPQLIGAVLILIVGWIVAKVIRRIVVKGLRIIRFDRLTEKSGIDSFLMEGGIRLTATDVLGSLVYWMLMLIIFLAVMNSLGLQIASSLLNQIILYIPNVIVATIIVIIGSFLAKFVQGALLVYLKNIKVAGAQGMSRIAQYAILVFAASIALDQLGIGRELVASAFQIAFGAFCLALALAFGLGGRDWAAKVMKKGLKGRRRR